MNVGFIARGHGGQVRFELVGGEAAERLVAFARIGGHFALLMGRLYHRNDLRARLGDDLCATADSSDAELLLAAYRRWGADCLERLEGDFALAIWDARQQRLLCARDSVGAFPLYWVRYGSEVAVSNCQRPLLDLLPLRDLNMEYLADYLALPAAFQEVPTCECAYRGLKRIEPGELVEVQFPRGTVKQRTYWDWLGRIEDPRTGDPETLSDELASRFQRAVHERARGTTAAHCSGGMDSTSVALVASEMVGNGRGPLHALALVYERHAGLARETQYVDAALTARPDIAAHRIVADKLLDYDSLVDAPPHDEPILGLRGLGIDAPLVDHADRAGAETILTGAGGDDLLDFLPHHIADLLAHGRVCSAWREARRWARATNNSPRSFLTQFGWANLLPVGLRAGLWAYLRRGKVSWNRQGEGTIAPWIHPEFARRHDLYDRGLRQLRRLRGNGRPVGQALALACVRAYGGDGCRWLLAAPRGIHVSHPFLDARLVSFALGLWTRYRQEPGRPKPLLARAMRDVLPPSIRERRRKGHFNEVYYAGLTRHLPALEAMVRQAPVDDLGLLDKSCLIRCLRETALGVARSGGGALKLDLALSAVKWLSMQDAWQNEMLSTKTISCELDPIADSPQTHRSKYTKRSQSCSPFTNPDHTAPLPSVPSSNLPRTSPCYWPTTAPPGC